MKNSKMHIRAFLTLLVSFVMLSPALYAQGEAPRTNTNKFRQMYDLLPTPNVYRTASGAPGHEYYQQRADYTINVELNDENQMLTGSQRVTYFNNSPDHLEYLWLQLDQNVRAPDSDTYKIRATSINPNRIGSNTVEDLIGHNEDYGYNIKKVADSRGNALPYTIVNTMMRIDLPAPLQPGQKFVFDVDWSFLVHDRIRYGGRGGAEFFQEDGNWLYTITQWYPRMAVYNDVEGWQNKQFLGRGEFALVFGNYDVKITVPGDHVVASTGELQNASQVLSAEERRRYEASKTSDKPVVIVTKEEAEAKEANPQHGNQKTWHYKAEMVRDFAWGSSRKYIWDAMGVKLNNKTVMAMSYYPKESNVTFGTYSTEVVAHTVETYSKFTFDYPYPVAISVEAANGMEYPMICFNYGRNEKDGTYSERTKYGMIGVIIHEVGHNWFPMIVNSDERQWTWMDEGLNTFLQYLTEQEFEPDYPSRRGPARNIVNYMKGDKQYIMPIMTNSESIFQFGSNAYGKPATALNILRETILGREVFDYAFKTYSQRWMFKHPTPADLFRTMEDASGTDLDWFWRGWFFTNDHVDISLDDVKWYQLSSFNPDVEKDLAKKKDEAQPKRIGEIRNAGLEKYTDTRPELLDFYNSYSEFNVDAIDRAEYERVLARMTEDHQELINAGYEFYELDFKNVGGLVMPIVLDFEFEDGTTEREYIPAEIWKMNPSEEVSKVFAFKKKVVGIVLDSNLETADTDRDNNYWPKRVEPTRFEMFLQGGRSQRNTSVRENKMQRAKRAEEMENN
ncbi:MAG: M1 family metallopeptidase [Bacteroidota bacterium]